MRPSSGGHVHATEGTISRFSEGTNNAFAVRKSEAANVSVGSFASETIGDPSGLCPHCRESGHKRVGPPHRPLRQIYFPTTFRSASLILSCQPGPAS